MILSLSILNLEKNNLETYLKEYETLTKNDWIHFDVMDGLFVENKTFNYELVKEVNKYSFLFKDVHLMTINPDDDLKEYKEAGTDQITFHYESVKKENIIDIINLIKNQNMKVGLSIKPNTRVREIEEYLPLLDLVLVMSVEPGKGGQSFMPSSLEKIKQLKIKQKNNHYLISVDGGINNETSKLVKEAGADVIVVGSYLTKDKLSKEKINNLK